MNMEKQQRQKGKFSQTSGSPNRSQEHKSFIFREVLDNNVITLNALCEVVDISLNENALKVLTEGKQVEENTHIVTVTWDTWKCPLCTSVCEISLPPDRKISITTILQGLFKDEYHHLRHIIETIIQDYTTRITHIQSNPFAIGFLHANREAFRRLESDVGKVENIFQKVFTKCAECQIPMELRLQLGRNTEKETDEHILIAEDTNSDSSDREDKRDEDEGQVVSGDRSDTKDKTYDETEKKFQEIEEKLKAQRNAIESKFDEQRKQSQKVNESLEKLLKHFQQLPITSDAQSPDKLDHSGNGSNEEPTISFTKKKEKDIYGDDKRGRNDDKYVAKKPEQKVCRDDTEDVADSPMSVASRTPEQLLTQQKQVKSLQLQQEKTHQPSSDKTSHSGTACDSNVASSRNKNKAGVQSTFEVGQGTSNTSDIPETSRFSDSNFGTMTIQREFGFPSSFVHQGAFSAGGAARQFLSSYGVQGSSKEVQRLIESVQQAMIDDSPMPPKARMSMETILCLDTSSSMGEEGLKEMKEIAIKFVDGIEDIASMYEKEENIAVVTFGGPARIAHHLSNDLSSVRNTIENLVLGGRSPLHEAFLVSLCSLNGRGAVINIGGVHLISPRLIIITDGKATDASEGIVDMETSDFSVKAQIVKLITTFKSQGPTFPKPIVWIPAGKANKDFLKSLAAIGNGKFLEGGQVTKLCNYQRIQQCAGEIFAYLQIQDLSPVGSFESEIDPILQAMAANMGSEEKEEIVRILREKLDGKKGCGNPGFEADDFDNVHEAEGLPPLGTRVTRGKDWLWDNQDTEGPGTIINHGDQSGFEKGLLWVLWDNGIHSQYRYGHSNAYDVKETPDQPRNSFDVEVGCQVTRGPDWRQEYGDQDGGVGGIGVVIRKNNSGKFKVRWQRTCYIGTYRYGTNGPKELSIRDPVECLMDLESMSKSLEGRCSPPPQSSVTEKHQNGSWVWKYKGEGTTWCQYSEVVNNKLEQNFAARPNRSCLIQRNGKSYRVLFKEMQEKSLDDESRREVGRFYVEK